MRRTLFWQALMPRKVREILALAFALAALAGSATAQSIVGIEGTVHDSLRGVPLARAVIVATSLGARHDTVFRSALADTHGRFAFLGLPPGRYALSVEHAILDSSGIGIDNVEVEVPLAGIVSVMLATPSASSLRRALCPESATDANVGVVLGVVRRTDGTPVPGAAVVFSWNDFDVDAPSVSVISHRVTSNAMSDSSGVYRRCAVPLSRRVLVQAQGQTREQSGILQEVIGISGVLVRDFRIAGDPLAAGAPVDSATATTALLLAGVVTDVRERPITSAQVVLTGSGRVATTNDRGEFRFAGAPAGTRSLEVMALGYYPRSLNVEVDRLTAPLRIRMERWAVVLDSLQVIAKRTTLARNLNHEAFNTRRTHGFGTFFTRGAIDTLHPQALFDVFRHAAGVKLAQQRGVWDMLLVSSRGSVALGATLCPLDVYLDGMRMKQEDLRGIPPELIYGIEIHTVATAPPQYKVGMCGAVFLWTR